MPLRVEVTFDVETQVAATAFARLCCDLQHLSLLMVAAGAPPRPLFVGPPDFDFELLIEPSLWKYSAFIEMGPETFGIAEIQFVHLRLSSPLIIDFLVKVPQYLVVPVARMFRIAFERLFYPDLERRKKTIAVERDAEELRQLRIDSFAKAIELERRIRDPQLRELYLQNLRSSITPFDREHPSILEFRVSEDTGTEDTGKERHS
jgi:hypothetical protein